MTDTNRKNIRAQFASLLTTAMVGTGLPVQAVYSYRVGDFAGASPVVVVSSYGAKRPAFTFQGARPMYRIQVDTFVLYATTDGTWTEEDAETALDDIEKLLADTIAANRSTDYWIGIDYLDFSQRVDVAVGGLDYIRETFVLEFK